MPAIIGSALHHLETAHGPDMEAVVVLDGPPNSDVVKGRAAIREAWLRHGVRDFVFDSDDELAKRFPEFAALRDRVSLALAIEDLCAKLVLSRTRRPPSQIIEFHGRVFRNVHAQLAARRRNPA